MHPRDRSAPNSAESREMFMPPVGRGQTDILTIPSSTEVRGAPVLKSYIPKNWKYLPGTSPDRCDAVSNPIVPSVVYSSPNEEIYVLYKGEAFYKHIDLTPATMQLQNKLDDILINRRNPSFLRMRSYMNCAGYCDSMVQTLPLRNTSLIKEEHASSEEKQRQRTILEDFRRKGFSDGSTEWLRRTYKGTDNTGDSQYEMLLITPENRYNEALAEFEKINNSIRILPEFNRVRAEIMAVINNSVSQMAMDNMNSMNRRSQIIADTNAYTSNIQHQMISDNAASHNRVANLHSEAIRGVNTYYTNDNRVAEASTAYDHVYQSTQNPNIFAAQQGNSLEFGVDFEELTRTNGDY